MYDVLLVNIYNKVSVERPPAESSSITHPQCLRLLYADRTATTRVLNRATEHGQLKEVDRRAVYRGPDCHTYQN